MLTLCTNLVSKTTSQFTNWNFNSMHVIGTKVYGASSEGLYRIGGATDDGVTIESVLKMAKTDFGKFNSKKFPYLYILVKTDANFTVELAIDDNDLITQEVEITQKGLNTLRVPTTILARGHEWQFTFKSSKSTYFNLIKVEGLPTVLHLGRA